MRVKRVRVLRAKNPSLVSQKSLVYTKGFQEISRKYVCISQPVSRAEYVRVVWAERPDLTDK